MENSKEKHLANEEESPKAVPSLIKAIAANEVAGFDSVKQDNGFNSQLKSTANRPLRTSIFGIEAAAIEKQNDISNPQRTHSVSISMPPSPIEAHLNNTKRVLFNDDETILGSDHIPNSAQTKQAKFYSQPMPKGSALNEAITAGTSTSNLPLRNPRIEKLQDKRFDSFKTWSGKLERQLSNLRGGKHRETEQESDQNQPHAEINLPVDRYFDALEGPELDTLRASEELLLPEDKKWPFLLRFPVSSFGICLGVSSQAIMWKTLASSPSTKFLHVSPDINLILWFISVALVLIVAIIYALKIIFYFEAVRREYYHPIRVNFFFAPFIALLFLALESHHQSLKLYMHPCETSNEREALPKELHPVFFLFVAAPSVASMAWARIQGSFDYGSRIAYFIALFLYFSLAVRVNFFRGFRFSLAWWAYTFPMTGAAIATIRYTNVVTSVVTKTLTVVLCIIATLTVAALLVTTIIHAFVLHDLFPNDIAIAISERKPKTNRRWYHRRNGSSETNIEQYLKYANSDGKDIEASINNDNNPTSPNEQDLSGSVKKGVKVPQPSVIF
ncbi:hypothetical protein DH2020_009869 [Rehmannia glutinosa]|uniref:Uncharacterized protein n=1 Tax=Rehmannia glutinosa TaxID=99300 RepID=A0ABR0X8S8_REHGL